MKHIGNYYNLWRSGGLTKRREAAWERLSCCDLCAHECRVNRRQGERGVCRADDTVQISGYGPHFGEETVLVGTGGSGTIFFTGCNLRCVFCQNWDISHLRKGETVSTEELSRIMTALQKRGCHNINLVTPTHYLPQILSALEVACTNGLTLPLVYNCGGYESQTALKLLDGVVDIYMPDVKFAGEEVGRRLTGAKNYPQAVKATLKEMHRQVGDLKIDADGLAWRGLLVRHLVLPEGLAGTEEIVHYIAEEISPHTYINIMAQYHPEYRAERYPPLHRPVQNDEYLAAVKTARQAGLYRLE